MKLRQTLVPLLASLAAAPAAEPSESAKSNRRVSLIYINDIHAQIEPHPELFWSGESEEYVRNAGGLSRIATVFDEFRQQQPGENLFIDGGDTIQGSGPAAWSKGEAVVDPMNALGLDLAIPGNWSVAYGAQAWKDRTDAFDYKMIAANMADAESGELLSEPYDVHEVNGVKVGTIGFTEPEIPTRQPPHLSEGLAFQGMEVLQPLIDELREEKNADLVVIATHIGLPKAVALADQLEGEDIILSADTHERTYEPIVKDDTWIVEAGAFASFVGKLDVEMTPEGDIAKRAWRLIELRPELVPQDPEVQRIVAESLAPHRERMDRVIGHTEKWLERYAVLNTSMDSVIARAIKKTTGADIALSNGFRFAPPTAPGAITEGDLWTWLPLKLQLKTGQASGEQFTNYWTNEFQNVFSDDPEELFGGWLPRTAGMSVEFHKNRPAGERVERLEIGGEPVEPDRYYTVAAGDRQGAPSSSVHRVRQCRLTRPMGFDTHEAVKSYLKSHSPVRGADEPNIRCVDCEGRLRSQFLSKTETPR